MKKILIFSIVASAELFFAASSAQAQTLINVAFNNTNIGTLSAGVVSSAGWQNLNTGDYYADGQSEGPYTLVDAQGNTTGITLSTFSDGHAGNSNDFSNFASAGDNALMNAGPGMFADFHADSTPATITLNGLNQNLTYNLYVYLSGTFTFGPNNQALVTVGPDSSFADATQGYFWTTDTALTQYIQDTSTTPSSSAEPVSNYIEFAGLTGSQAQALTFYTGTDGGAYYVKGIQLQLVPEPSAYVLIGLGFCALVILRRRTIKV